MKRIFFVLVLGISLRAQAQLFGTFAGSFIGDGSALTNLPLSGLASSGTIVTQGNSFAITVSNQFRIDAAHALVVSNTTASSIAGFDGAKQLTNVNIGAGLTLSGNTLDTAASGATTTINARMTTNQTSTTSVAANVGMNNSCTLTAGKTYGFQGVFFLTESVTGEGASMTIGGGSATTTNVIIETFAVDDNSGHTNLAASLLSGASLNIGASTPSFANGYYLINGTISVDSGGTFIPKFGQASHSSGTLTMKQGSRLQMWEIP